MDTVPECPTSPRAADPDLGRVIDEELTHLPDRVRDPVVLCLMQGLNYEETASRLGCSVSTVCRRVAEGTELLRARVGRRGYGPGIAGAVVVAAVAPEASAVPVGLASRAVSEVLATVASGVVGNPAAVQASDAVVRSLVAARRVGNLVWAGVALAGVTLVAGGGWWAWDSSTAIPTGLPPLRKSIGDRPQPEVELDDRVLPEHAIARFGSYAFRTGTQTGTGDVAIFPGAKQLASAHGEGIVRIWDTSTGRCTDKLTGPKAARAVATSPDGKRLVAVGMTDAWCWDLTQQPPRIAWKRVHANSNPVAVMDSAGQQVVVPDSPQSFAVIAVGSGEVSHILSGRSGGPRPAFSPDGAHVYLVSTLGGVEEWDLTVSPATSTAVVPRTETIAYMAIAPNGRALVTSNRTDSFLKVWEPDAAPRTLPTDGPGSVPGFLPDGTLVELSSTMARFHDLQSGKETRPTLRLLGFSPWDGWVITLDGKTLASAGSGRVGAWELANGTSIGPAAPIAGSVEAVALSASGKTVATCSGRFADHWDVATGRRLRREELPEVGNSSGAAFTRRGAVTSLPFELRVTEQDWAKDQLPTRTVQTSLASLEAMPQNSHTSVVSADGMWLACGSIDGPVLVRRDTRRTLPLPDSSPDTLPVGFSSNGETLLAYSRGQNRLEHWKVSPNRVERTCGATLAEGMSFPAELSADASRLTARMIGKGAIGGLGVWDTTTGHLLHSHAGDRIAAFTLSPDGQRLALGGTDGTVAVVDALTGVVHRSFRGHRGTIRSLAFSANGERLVSGSADATAVVWAVGW